MKADFFERGGLWVIGQFSLLILALLAGLFWHAQWDSQPIRALGWFFSGIGAFCGLCGVRALGSRNLTPFTKPTDKAVLVTTGIYSWIRHPLYTAVGCGVAGWALVRASLPALFCAGSVWVFLDFKSRREEAHLNRIFANYKNYSRRVKCFIPWLY